jgi:hypothetical protein
MRDIFTRTFSKRTNHPRDVLQRTKSEGHFVQRTKSPGHFVKDIFSRTFLTVTEYFISKRNFIFLFYLDG